MKEANAPAYPSETEYSKAWKQYCSTQSYSALVTLMLMKGLQQPYIDNILRDTFDAGWNAKHELSKPQQT